ncbi:hypothetical protein [Micromonospora sp. CA-248212]|uniref:hypothetical protein n=1 Tax=Micromonospora sp. CA-248212 TaxID=3239961 RepID=UPI003D93FC5C
MQQWRDRIDGARLREVLITGYTVDLGFLEKFAIPTARALGARITVLGDPGQAVHDPVDVRRAGVAYQHGHAVCSRAFHPKLVVLLGDRDVWLAVGSGNPTLSGWGYNHELWVTAYGSVDLGPQLIHDIADWLHDLPDAVGLASWVAKTIRHVSERMRPQQVDERWSQVRAFGNLHEPLLNYLPAHAVDELRLAAPFYDPPARAATAIVARMLPQALRVAVQPSIAMFDGAALARAAAPVVDQKFTLLGGGRACHGKLIEWRTPDGKVSGMTGSANITTSALLISTRQGGNCELAVIAPHGAGLFPSGGDPQPPNAIQNLRSAPPASTTSASGPVLLGCALVDGTLIVELAKASGDRVAIETSPTGAPGSWAIAGAIPANQQSARLLVPEVTGGAVRAVMEVAGVRLESAAVFITDSSRCRPRQDTNDTPRLSWSGEVGELFGDPLLAQRFTNELGRLVEQVGLCGHTPSSTSTTSESSQLEPGDRWADYLEQCEHTLGSSLSGLIFPKKHAGGHGGATHWSIDDVDEGEVTEDEDDEVLDGVAREQEEDPATQVPQIRPDQRAKYRRFAERWVTAVTEPAVENDWSTLPPVHLRMVVTRLYLMLLAAGVWHEDDDWRHDLRWLIWSLIPDDDMLDAVPAEAFDHLYALLAVAMTTLRQGTHLHGGREEDLPTTDAWADAAEWVAEVDVSLAHELLLPATQPFAHVATAEELHETVRLAGEVRQDPYAEVRVTLADTGLDVDLQDGVWRVEGGFTNPYRAAARAATELVRIDGSAAVVAQNSRCAVLIAVAGKTMVLVDSRMAVWRLYSLSGTRTPLSMTSECPGPPPNARVFPLRSQPPEISEIEARLSLDLPSFVAGMRSLIACT